MDVGLIETSYVEEQHLFMIAPRREHTLVDAGTVVLKKCAVLHPNRAISSCSLCVRCANSACTRRSRSLVYTVCNA